MAQSRKLSTVKTEPGQFISVTELRDKQIPRKLDIGPSFRFSELLYRDKSRDLNGFNEDQEVED